MNISRNRTVVDYIRDLVRNCPTSKPSEQEIAYISQLIDQEKAQVKEECMKSCRNLEQENKRLKIVVDSLADYINQNMFNT